jgi:hypothetical protein
MEILCSNDVVECPYLIVIFALLMSDTDKKKFFLYQLPMLSVLTDIPPPLIVEFFSIICMCVSKYVCMYAFVFVFKNFLYKNKKFQYFAQNFFFFHSLIMTNITVRQPNKITNNKHSVGKVTAAR